MMAKQDRRSFLRWAVNGLGALFAAVLGVPAVAYLIDGRNRTATAGGFKRVARLSDLTPGRPRVVTVRQTRSDAWTLHPDEIVGRVFLIRREGDRVDAYTTICPHLGCSVNYTGNADVPFLCPCHGGRFDLHGHRIETGGNNPAPRGMDSLQVQRVPVPDSPAGRPDFYIEVQYQTFKPMAPEKEVRA
jgi:Rieske Fe-S protein